MRVTFWGAAQTVTGSMHHVEAAGKKFLLDCGLYQGRRSEAFERNSHFPFPVSSIDGVILSHAHIDHSGNLPTLVHNGYSGPIYSTPATVDLCLPMLADSAHLQQKDVEFCNRRREHRFANAGNRRGEHRFPCKLGAEVYRLGTKVPNRCILSDISEGGCYVEMPSPFSGRSGVEILVRTADTKLRITGQVLTTHPGFGMGVRFMFRDSDEREEVLRLLAVLSSGPSLDEQHR